MALDADKPIIAQFKTDGIWLWRQWKGTVLETTWKPALLNMAMGVALTFFVRRSAGALGVTWPLGAVPPSDLFWIQRLSSLGVMWGYQLTLATFILTFFLGQAYSFWRSQFSLARAIQGRLQQIALLFATHAARDGKGAYTPPAQKVLAAVARNIKLLQICFWAGQDVNYAPLLAPEGLRKLEGKGVLSASEASVLLDGPSPPKLRHDVVLEWLIVRANAAQHSGAVIHSHAFDHEMIHQATRLHGTCGGIMDNKEDRMPLTYVHIVQLLVDSLLFVTPAALYPKLGIFSVPMAGLFTVFYRGLLVIGKDLLDPFNGDDDTDVNVDVLLAEVNVGATRFYEVAAVLPDDLAELNAMPAAEH